MGALKDKAKEKACQEFVLNGGSQSDAYRAAYKKAQRWKNGTIWNKASQLFLEPEVQERVDELRAEVAAIAEEQFKVDASYVLGRLVEIDQMDAADILSDDGSVKQISDWPKVWRQFISGMDLTELYGSDGGERQSIGFLKKIKWPDKVKNLELIGKHVSVQAFKEKVETTEIKQVESLTDQELDDEIERRIAAASSS